MKRLLGLAVGAMLLAPVGAGAAERTRVESGDDSVTVEREERSTRARLETTEEEPQKVDVSLNGGIGDFAGDLGNLTELGPAYGLMAGVSTMNDLLTAEIGFQGHTNAIEGAVPGRLTNSKMQVDLKAGPELNLPVPWRPYAFGGVGVNWVSSSNDASGLTDGVMGVIPLGIGADFFTDSPIRVGARATYDLTPGIGSDVGATDDLEHPDAWNAAITAAAAF